MAPADNPNPGAAPTGQGTAPAAAGTPAAAATPASGTPAAGGPSWADILPEDVRAHAYPRQFKDAGEFARNAIEAQALIGRKGAIIPKDDAPPEDWGKFYEQLGRPAEPTEYKYTAPEGYEFSDADKSLQEAMRPVAHKAGLSQKQLDQLAGGLNEYTTGIAKRNAEQVAKAKETLKQEWAGDYDKNMNLADRAFRQFGDKEAAELLQIRTITGGFLLDDPRVARVFSRIGASLAEDGGAGGRPGHSDPFGSPAAAKAEVEKIERESYGNPKHPLNDARHPDHRAIHDRQMKLRMVYAEAEARATGGGA